MSVTKLPMRKCARAIVFIAVIGAAFLFARRVRRKQPLSVLLITLDTTRADRLGCYGYDAGHTPALDRLASEGLRFTEAFTHVPLTLPSHASLLTGLLPPEHGLRDNGRGRLNDNVQSIAETLKARGYRTGAFLASFVLDRQFGLAQGFDVYDDRMSPPARGDNVFDRENRADIVCDRALAWLQEHAEGPFFCWVHFFDPHDPYDPPEPYRTQYRDLYDGEIAFMDSQVARLLEAIEREDLAETTLVIACADHGEAFGEHGETGHGVLVYGETMHVPLLLRLPGLVPRGNSDRLVGLTDIPATILDVLGVRRHGFAGVSALSAPDDSAACYGESLFSYHTYGWAPLYSLTGTRWKYIQAPAPELYDLANDPGEQRNLAGTEGAVLVRHKSTLRQLRASMQAGRTDTVELDPEAVAKLRSLGYLGGTSSVQPPEESGDLRDPKTVVASVHGICTRARVLIKQGRNAEAVQILKPILELSPESQALHENLVEAFLNLGKPLSARPHIETILAMDPDNRPMLANLGGVYLEARRYGDAAATYQRVLTLPHDPREPCVASGVSKIILKSRSNLGLALTKLGQAAQAAEQYRQVLAADPNHLEACNNLGNIYVRQKRNKEAIRQFSACLRIDPRLKKQRENLGRLLWSERRHAEALRAWSEGLKHHPQDPVFLYHLAWRLATVPEPRLRDAKRAVRYAESLCAATQWNNAQALDCLAAAYAEAGDFAKAVTTAERGLTLAKAIPEGVEMAREIEQHLRLYRQSKPLRIAADAL